MSEEIRMAKLGSLLDDMNQLEIVSAAIDSENSRLRAQLAERDERIAGLCDSVKFALGWFDNIYLPDDFNPPTADYGAQAVDKLKAALTRATSSKIAGGAPSDSAPKHYRVDWQKNRWVWKELPPESSEVLG